MGFPQALWNHHLIHTKWGHFLTCTCVPHDWSLPHSLAPPPFLGSCTGGDITHTKPMHMSCWQPCNEEMLALRSEEELDHHISPARSCYANGTATQGFNTSIRLYAGQLHANAKTSRRSSRYSCICICMHEMKTSTCLIWNHLQQ
jgi:hypothetical protein